MATYGSIHRHRMMVSAVKESPSLQMTDYFFLFSLFLMLFWAIDPLRVGLDMIGGVKRLPTILLVINLCFITIGRLMFVKRSHYKSMRSVLMDIRYLVAFSAMVIGGSLYAKFVSGIDETFLTMGVFTLIAPITYWYVMNSSAPMKLLRAILIMFTFWAVVSAMLQGAFFRQAEIFHSREHLVLPALATLFYFAPWRIGRYLALGLVILVAIATNKNTGFILALFVSGYLVSVSFFRRFRLWRDALLKMTVLIGFLTLMITAVAGTWVAYNYFGDYMPTGNPEYRLHTYGIALDKFLSSPVWGNLFTKPAVEFFDQFEVAAGTQNLPTHSDPLDILANGGLIAIALWICGIAPRIWEAFASVSVHARTLPWAVEWMHQSFLLMTVTAVFVCLFNPIYNVPNLATANWMLFGCMLASTRLCKQLLENRS